MDFLFSALLSFFSTFLFLKVWRVMPVSWLFDCSDLSPEEQKRPHPRSRSFSRRSSSFLLFLSFFAVSFIFVKKVALTDVFWVLSLFWLSLQIALADHHYRLIPDQWSLGILLLGILRLVSAAAASGHFRVQLLQRIAEPFPALVLCIITALFLHGLPRLLNRPPALGLGDVKLLFALAIALTTEEFLSLLILCSLLGGIAAIALILLHILRGISLDQGLPFGTFIFISMSTLFIFSQ